MKTVRTSGYGSKVYQRRKTWEEKYRQRKGRKMYSMNLYIRESGHWFIALAATAALDSLMVRWVHPFIGIVLVSLTAVALTVLVVGWEYYHYPRGAYDVDRLPLIPENKVYRWGPGKNWVRMSRKGYIDMAAYLLAIWPYTLYALNRLA